MNKYLTFCHVQALFSLMYVENKCGKYDSSPLSTTLLCYCSQDHARVPWFPLEMVYMSTTVLTNNFSARFCGLLNLIATFMFEIDVNYWLNTGVFQKLGIRKVCLMVLST